MAGWISSKLKVAEHLLQQIDQQAAESLGQGERKPSEEFDLSASPKLSSSVSLKDQLKKKAAAGNDGNFGKLNSASSGNDVANRVIRSDPNDKQKSGIESKSLSTVNDADWTDLLNSPGEPVAHPGGAAAGLSGVRRVGLRVGMNVKADGSNALGRGRKQGKGIDGKANATVGGGGTDTQAPRKSSSVPRISGVGCSDKVMESLETIEDSRDVIKPMGIRGRDDKSHHIMTRGKVVVGNGPGTTNGISESVSVQMSNGGYGGAFDEKQMERATMTMNNRNGDVSDYVSGVPEANSHHQESESDSDSGSGSSSTSNSEVERERKERIQKRRQILAERAVLKASVAIKQHENVVARLEGEKQSLEKILEERAKQAAQEALELQSTMMETMEAAELEKQKHNHTRMEVLARLAKIETANADFAKSLAGAQWNLEMEVKNVAELRRLVDAKELVHEELKKHICSTLQTRTSLASLMPSKGFELERGMLEAEYSFITEKTALLKEKATKLAGDIDEVLKEMGSATVVEVELKSRLCQMTDHLIQKQAQVEALSSEKATLSFRNEAILRLLDENKPLTDAGYMSGNSREDLEGTCDSAGRKLRMFEVKIQSGKQHLGSLVRQLDVVFHAGAVFVARNPAAKSWSLVYFVCLHLWVLYNLFSHLQPTENSASSSVLSLENINNSIGV